MAETLTVRVAGAPDLSAIDALCREHAVRPGDIGEVYISVGPGSFTGLRVAMSCAVTLTLAQPVRLALVARLFAVRQTVWSPA